MNRCVALALGLTMAAGPVSAQDAFVLQNPLPRGAIHAFENDVDVRGFRLGDSEAEVQKVIADLSAEVGQISIQTVEQHGLISSGQAQFAYTEGLVVQFVKNGVSDTIRINFGTPASGAGVDAISRTQIYLGDILPPVDQTVRSVEAKYGIPTTSAVIVQDVYLGYIWANGQLLPTDAQTQPESCLRSVTGVAFRYPAEPQPIGDCTATLTVSVASDGEGRVSMVTQLLTSVERIERDTELSNAYIAAAIEAKASAAGARVPDL